jgi:hypothetical protein
MDRDGIATNETVFQIDRAGTSIEPILATRSFVTAANGGVHWIEMDLPLRNRP